MKAILTKKIISCIAISGVLSFSAFEIMAANQQRWIRKFEQLL